MIDFQINPKKEEKENKGMRNNIYNLITANFNKIKYVILVVVFGKSSTKKIHFYIKMFSFYFWMYSMLIKTKENDSEMLNQPCAGNIIIEII